jgi:hypothetical protein
MERTGCPLCGGQLLVRRDTQGYEIWVVRQLHGKTVRVEHGNPIEADVHTAGLPVVMCRNEECKWIVMCRNEECKWTAFYTAKSLEW